MKKFTKICLILSSLFLCIGVIFVVVGANFGGTLAFKKLLYHNAFTINSDSFFSGKDTESPINKDSESAMDNETENDESSINEDMKDISENGTANAANQNFSTTDVQNLNLNVSYGEIYLSTSNDINDIQVVAQNMDSTYRASTSDGTLSILSEKKNEHHLKFNTLNDFDKYDKQHPIIKITFPSDYKFTNSSLNLDAGYIKISQLNAKELTLSLNAGLCTVEKLQISSSAAIDIGTGKFDLQSGNVTNLNLSCGAGQAVISSELDGKTSLTCSVGEILLTTNGTTKDFNYNISCDVGSIDIDHQTFSGLNLSKNINNNASKSFDLTCNVGHIKVSFK